MASKKYYKLVAENRKAYFDYHLLETYQAGLILTGNEVKSVRLGRINLKDSFARAEKGEIWIYGMHLSPYETAAEKSKINPLRPRKVLLRKQQLVKLIGRVSEKGLTIIPLKVYFEGNWAKVDLALAKAKRKYEKREALRRKAIKREIEATYKGKIHGNKI
ncbi:MAG: SsrA-binding protein SmpB [Candidatus Margulisiibacteriota bacterium]